MERALEIAIHHYLTHKDCPGKNKLQHDDPRHILHIAGTLRQKADSNLFQKSNLQNISISNSVFFIILAKLYLSPNATPFCVEQAVQATLEQLDTDYIDLLIISIANNDNLPSIWQVFDVGYLMRQLKISSLWFVIMKCFCF